MGLLIICFDERRKLCGTEDMGPTSAPCLFFLKLDRNTKQIAMQLIKTSNAEDIEEYQEESGVTPDT